MTNPGTLVLIMVIAVLAPVLAFRLVRWLPVPLVIFEIVLGVIIGPDVLGWAHPDAVVEGLSELGLAMLIFLAGYEIEFDLVRGDTLRRSVWSWLIALVLGLGLAFLLTGGEVTKSLVIGTALTSTALGTVLPILRDSGDLAGRFGTVMMAVGAVGEFGPIIATALLLSGSSPGRSAALLVAFALVSGLAMLWARRDRPAWFSAVVDKTLHSSGQFSVRLVMLMLVGMVALASSFGVDILLGAFAAGLLTRLVLNGTSPESSAQTLERVEAIGFGFFVPVFFIVTGIDFDLDSLLSGGRALALLPAFLVLFLVVRGLPVYLLAPKDLTQPDRRALTLFASTALPLVVAITTIGLDDGVLGSGEAAALVGAGMLSVLVFPLLALRIRNAGTPGTPGARPSRSAEASESW